MALLADALTVHDVPLYPVCQEELYDPGRDVSINPNGNSILTPQRPVPDVRLGYTSTRQRYPFIAEAAVGFLALMVRSVPLSDE